MGEPKFSRKKFARPVNPWEAVRIKNENELLKKYGLKNKKELWRAEFMLRGFREQSKELQAKLRIGHTQAQKETAQLITRLTALAMLPDNATLDDVLALNVETILGRRFQTLLYLKGYAGSAGQARQLIIHGHAVLNGRKVTVPGYLVKHNEEGSIGYNPASPIADDMHPARPKKDGYVAPQPVAQPAEAAPPVEAAQPEKKTEPEPEKKAEPAKADEKKTEKTAEKPAEKTAEKAAEKPAKANGKKE